MGRLKDGESCGHPGCLSHLSHPCEECGRVGGSWERTANYYAHQLAAAEARERQIVHVFSRLEKLSAELGWRRGHHPKREAELRHARSTLNVLLRNMKQDFRAGTTIALDAALEQAREAGYKAAMEGIIEGVELEDTAVVADIWQRGKKAGEEEYRTKWLAAANGVESLREECERLEHKLEQARAEERERIWKAIVPEIYDYLDHDEAQELEIRLRGAISMLGKVGDGSG